MRKNLPIADVETTMRPDQYLISKTNKKGVITYANPAFVEVSGFTYGELMRQPHNMVRHPDMPPAAFEDLWTTLQAGKPWLGMVKNRRKDGGYYWVLANATPIVTHGAVTGYASVRVKPSAQQVQDAEQFYQQINTGQASGYRIQQGSKEPTGWRAWPAAMAAPFRSGLRPALFRLMLGFLLLLAGTIHATTSPRLASMTADWLPLVCGLLAMLLCLYGWRVASRMLRSVEEASAIARQISAGNLAVDIHTNQRDETRMLFFYLDLMRKSLMDIAGNVRSGVDATVHAAGALSTSNTRLSQRTEEQAAALQQTAASMEQFAVTVQQNADNAKLANQLTTENLQTAERGGQAVHQVIDTIHGIRDGSRRMMDIVSLIDGIAFQTNILALNAAVESARAGAAGRGFAVVAGEVRNLAQRSSEAAKEIRTLIDGAVAQVAHGADQARHAGDTMRDIVQSVNRTTQVMSQISAASAEQAIGVTQIRTSIRLMDTATQDNAAMVQELGETAQRLLDDGVKLQQTIEVLDTDGVQDAPPRSAATATPSVSHASAIRHVTDTRPIRSAGRSSNPARLPLSA